MEDVLKTRQYDILKMLAVSAMPLDMDVLTGKFNKSERTIRYDIDKLREICSSAGIEIRYKTKLGYYIPAEQKSLCTQFLVKDAAIEKTEQGLESENTRIRELFFYFMVKKRDTTAEQIAGDLYTSRSTLMRMIERFNNTFGNEIVLLSYKTGGYELVGDEYTVRQTGAGYLSDRLKGSYTPEDWLLLIPGILKSRLDLRIMIEITNKIKKINSKYNVWISNSAFINLLSYCLIRYVRLYDGKKVQDENSRNDIWTEYSGYAAELLKEVGEFNGGMTKTEFTWLQRVLKENRIMVGSKQIEEKHLEKCFDEICSFLRERGEKIDFEGLHEDLYEHLKNTISFCMELDREEEENVIVIKEVKENYPYFYSLAKECTAIIEKSFRAKFTRTEVCYIGIYLYKNCTEKGNAKKNVLLVCATGKGLSHLLSIRLENVFPTINIAGQRSPYQLVGLKPDREIDFIISTIPLNITGIPVVKISRILSADDIKRIQEFLDYGKLVDEIPLQEQAKASFSAKADPFQIEHERGKMARADLPTAATVISKLILTLLEYTSKFPEKYRMGQDALLGLIIHMSMAIPRWFQEDEPDSAGEAEEYARIARKHGAVFEIMEKFFTLIESSLNVSIPAKERISFFLYIILKEELQYESDDD